MTRPTTPLETLEFFAQLSPSTIKLGLERVHSALDRLGHPERRYPALHVAGTNGKGSTCAFVDAALRAQGYKVGLYTSPHLVRVNERIRVDGEEISDEVFGTRILELIDRIPEIAAGEYTYFEVGTLVAFWHFAQEHVDLAVLETGLGGRLDATNACAPAVTAITQIDFDHMAYLGNTLTEIAGEKAGILKPGVPAVISSQPPEALARIEEVAREVGAPLIREGHEFTAEWAHDEVLTYRGRTTLEHARVSLHGPHQLHNAATALASLEALNARGILVSTDSMREGIATATWPGRFEELGGDPLLVLDGAHNPGGVRSLLDALDARHPGKQVHLVFGVLADKDHGPMVSALFPRCASVQLAPVPSPRSLDPETYVTEARTFAPGATAHGTVESALHAAKQAARKGEIVLCAGSLVLIGAIKRLLSRV